MSSPAKAWSERFGDFTRVGIRERLQLLSELGLADEDIGTAFDSATARSVRRWRLEGLSPRTQARRWEVIDDIGTLVAAYFAGADDPTPETIVHWLRSRNLDLDEERPLPYLAGNKPDAYRRVRAALDRDLLTG